MERTYGEISLCEETKKWEIKNPEAHISIKLKSIFENIAKNQIAPFYFNNSIQVCADLFWFMQRYKLRISDIDLSRIKRGKKKFYDRNDFLEGLLSPDYVPKELKLKDGFKAREYQAKGSEIILNVKRILNGDDLGLGKTVTAIVSMKPKISLPVFIVVQSHMVGHWKEKVELFTNLTTHVVKGRKPYNLPSSDVYIIKYSCLQGWVDLFPKLKYKFVIYDEIQEVRRSESMKHESAIILSSNSEYVLGLSATPIYNYGDEVYNIMQVIKPNSLGTKQEFLREWCDYGDKVKDPKALGTYLRESFLFFKRTRKDVGRELPVVNTIIHNVDYDESEVRKSQDLAKTLALKVMSGSFVERGQAARELDILARQTTGVAKAKYVAEFVKLLLQSGEPIILAGWHRDVYEIWDKELKDYKVVYYTGTESPAQKEKSKQDFINGDADVFVISLRSGVGLDGLQARCSTVVFGELDWSPEVHNQVIGRADRDGQEKQVTAYYLISNTGSDLPMINVLGVKASQSQGIINPNEKLVGKFTDESRMKKLAAEYLKEKN